MTKGEVPMMRIVAELMIAANAAVAEKIAASAGRFGGCAFVRRHPPPRPEGFDELAGLMKRAGVSLDASNGVALASSLASAVKAASDEASRTITDDTRSDDKNDRRRSTRAVVAATDALFRGVATRAMSEARYCCVAGDAEGSSHYGLALTLYTHFTSPIRRYADVVVHRQLMDAVADIGDGNGNEKSAPGDEKSAPGDDGDTLGRSKSFSRGLAKVAHHLNERNRAAKRAQARCAELYLLETLALHPRCERAVVHEIRDDGFVAFVPRFHIRVGIRLVSDSCPMERNHRRDDDRDVTTGVGDFDAVLPAPTTTFTEVRRRREDSNPGRNDYDSPVASSDDVWMRADAPRAVPGVRLERRSADDDDDDEEKNGESLAWTYTSSAMSSATSSRALPPLPPPLRVLSPVWVQLSCERRGARGPRLVGTLLDEKHPAVIDAGTRRRGEDFSSSAAMDVGDEAAVEALARGLEATDLNGGGGGRPGSGESPVGAEIRIDPNPPTRFAYPVRAETTSVPSSSVTSSSSVVWAGHHATASCDGAMARAREKWWRAQARAALAAMRAAATRAALAAAEDGKETFGGDARLERRKRRAAIESLRARVERRRLEDVLVGGGGERRTGRSLHGLDRDR